VTTDRRRLPWGWGTRLVVGAIGAVVAARLAPHTLSDDAAISFRYAARLAAGQGLTYNDHERVLGVSNGLYTLALSALDRFGVTPPVAARAIGVAAVGLTAVLVLELAGRLSDRHPRRAGLAAVAVICISVPFVGLATSGLEAGLAAALGLGAFLALLTGRPGLAGVFAGLALVNKLDAALLVLALSGAAWSGQRRPPVRLLLTAGAVAAPWFVFGAMYYGTLLPQSLAAKLAGEADVAGYALDPTWALRLLSPVVPLLAFAAVAAWRQTTAPPTRAVLGGLLSWSGLQIVAASLLPLGGEYGWYLTVAVPPLAVAAGVAIAGLDDDRQPAVLRWATGAALALAVFWGTTSTGSQLVRRAPDSGDLLERDRIAAGRWLATHAEADDVLDTCFGWVAFEAPASPIADPCGLTSDRAPGPVTWRIEAPVGDDEDCRGGASIAATFTEAQTADAARPRIVVCRAMHRDR